jgi:hypothetical protein
MNMLPDNSKSIGTTHHTAVIVIQSAGRLILVEKIDVRHTFVRYKFFYIDNPKLFTQEFPAFWVLATKLHVRDSIMS